MLTEPVGESVLVMRSIGVDTVVDTLPLAGGLADGTVGVDET